MPENQASELNLAWYRLLFVEQLGRIYQFKTRSSIAKKGAKELE
ncbi:hypothetical protein DOT_2401 [Desulfosporosinus sp. OT]|nr:hypothetical protein DOT_2401 [Desulfosporosinus sp. OT]